MVNIMEKTNIYSYGSFTIPSPSDGLPISIIEVHSKEAAPKGIIQIVHGMCEHKERYIPFMDFMVSKGYACIIHDHRGHGQSVYSSEDLGYFYAGGFKAMIEDIRMVTAKARWLYPGVPVILLGHSMGSMAVRSFAKRYSRMIDALIVCGSPSSNPGAGLGKVLTRIYSLFKGERYRPKLIQNIAFGAFNHNFRHEGSHNAWICSDKTVVDAYDKDPLCSFQFTANGFINLFSLMQDAYSSKGWSAPDKDLPVLFISGEDDPCMIDRKKFYAAVENMRNAGYGNVRSVLYKGMRHEILNEKGKEKVWNDILEFININ